MSINRYNYQEYFLLYTDNELPAADRKLVEDFVDFNPEFAEELAMLRQTILKPEEDVLFESKELLFQFEGTDNIIHPGNFEEFAVGYSDNELNETDRAHLKKFLANNPDFQQDFDLINSIKLDADKSIIFPDKHLLYRTEKPERIFSPWWRVAAAALVLIFAGTLWYNQQADAPATPKLADVESGASAPAPGKTATLKSATPAPVDLVNEPARVMAETITERHQTLEINKAKPLAGENSKRSQSTQRPNLINNPNDSYIAPNGIARTSDINESITDKQLPPAATINNGSTGKNSPANSGSMATLDASIGEGSKTLQDPLDVKINAPGRTEYNVAKTVAHTDDDENIALPDNLTERKSPLREIIRKASRFIDKNTASRTSRKSGLLIGNVQIAFQ